MSFEDITLFSQSFNKDPRNTLAMNAVTKNGIAPVALSRREVDRRNFTFSDLIESPDATNQERSGRCWLFSGLSLLSLEAMKKLNLKTFELSEIYQMFWDKLEKANYFLESMMERKEEPLDGRLVTALLSDPISDGGQWNMFVNLVKKYGVLPKTFMPETACSNNSDPMNTLLASKLREYAKALRHLAEKGAPVDELRKKKAELMEEFYRILCINLGVPPKTFYWEWRDKDEHFHRRGDITPAQFYSEYIGVELDDFVSLINSPNRAFNTLYTVQYSGNMVGAQETRYLNVDLKTMKKATTDMIKGNHPVWFGCDVGKMLEIAMGAMDLNIYDYESVYGTKFQLDKAARLDYQDSEMTHAMVITGVDLDEKGNARKWRVENSWGATIGHEGYMYMMDEWFDEYVYEVVVRKEYLSRELLKVLDTQPVLLPYWDPLSSLAKR
ncbi:MAG TPA: C1 family peptidase [Candidatus Dormibacteraeota bacterium]|nr:C1 family peptidase [Candidatus Dormibacteraeota bacterium]